MYPHGRRGNQALWHLFYEALTPLMGVPSQSFYLLLLSLWGLRFQCIIFSAQSSDSVKEQKIAELIWMLPRSSIKSTSLLHLASRETEKDERCDERPCLLSQYSVCEARWADSVNLSSRQTYLSCSSGLGTSVLMIQSSTEFLGNSQKRRL